MIGDPLIEKLRVIRRAQGLGARKTERRAGVGVNTIGQWEAGGGATLSKVRKVANALGYDVELVRMPPKSLTLNHKAALARGREDAATARAGRDTCAKGHDLRSDDAIYFDDSGGVRCAQCRRDRSARHMRATRSAKDKPFPLIPRTSRGGSPSLP